MLRTAIVISTLASFTAVASASVTGTFTFGGNTTPTNQTPTWNMTADTLGGFSVLRFVPDNLMSFSSYTDLSYTYDMLLGGIGGGSPRVVIVLDTNNNNVSDGGDGFINLFWGPSPGFVDNTLGTGLTTGNLLALTDNGRYDLSPMGGSPFTDRAAALALAGGYNVLRFSLILDTYVGAMQGSAGGDNRELVITGVSADGVPAPAAAAVLGLGGLIVGRRRR